MLRTLVAVLACASFCLIGAQRASARKANHAASQRSPDEKHALGNAPCAWPDPVLRADGGLDAEGMIHALQAAGFTCTAFVISGSGGNSYESFQRLLRAADAAEIDVWAVLIPPSEGASSLPYRSDYAGWMKELAKLSLQHEHFRGVNIDDIDQGDSPETFTRDYLCNLYRTKQEVNPRLQFVPTVYDLDTQTADRLAGCVDGVWLWWVNLEKATGLPSFLENSKLAVRGRFPIYGGVYAHWTSWHKDVNPVPQVFEESLQDASKHSDGVMIWRMSLDPADPLLQVHKRFLSGSSGSDAQASGDATHSMTEQHAMGPLPCTWSGARSKPDGSLDPEGTVENLKALGFRCTVFVISGPGGWENFQKLVAAADAGGIDVWPVLIPPSEGATSLPHGKDYIAWIEALAKESLKYPHLRGANIDDLDQGNSPETFTREYVCKIYAAKQSINPKLQFVPTVYDLDTQTADRLAGCVDGVWLWWVNLEKATGLPSFLENSKLAVRGRFPIYGGVYAMKTSWHKEGNPVPKVFEETLEDTCAHADGAVIYLLQLEENNPLLAITKNFLASGTSPYADRCGTGIVPAKKSAN
jgi:hypothetical protein